MSDSNTILNTLKLKFDRRKTNILINYFSGLIQNFEQGDWGSSLVQSGKFVEVTIKLIWMFAGQTLPSKAKDFKIFDYATRITNLPSATISNNGIRLQIPRACIFLYDIVSNRGGRHDSDEFNPSEMDAVTASTLCSWILAELIRFCTPGSTSPDEAKEAIESVIEKHYPIFEEIEGRIYIDDKKHKSAIQCALMILYKKFPKRMKKTELTKAVMRHKYNKSALKFERLSAFIDSDENGNILLRANGRRKVKKELLLNYHF